MNTADFYDVRRDRLRGVGYEMAVYEHQRRRDGCFTPNVWFRFVGFKIYFHVDQSDPNVSVQNVDRVREPLHERSGNGVVGHQRGYGGRVRKVAEDLELAEAHHRQRDGEYQRQVGRGRQIREAVRHHRLDEDRVEIGSQPFAGRPLRDVFHRLVAVYGRAAQLVHRLGEHDHQPHVKNPFQQFQIQADHPREHAGQVHLGVVFPVAVRERREHRDVVTVVRQRPQHRAHEVPMALARHRFHGQYAKTVGRGQKTRDDRRENNDRAKTRHRPDKFVVTGFDRL